MAKLLTPPKSITQQFRDLKVGRSLKMRATHYSAPHSFAKSAKIKIETEVLSGNATAGFVIKVTRLAPYKKKTAGFVIKVTRLAPYKKKSTTAK